MFETSDGFTHKTNNQTQLMIVMKKGGTILNSGRIAVKTKESIKGKRMATAANPTRINSATKIDFAGRYDLLRYA